MPSWSLWGSRLCLRGIRSSAHDLNNVGKQLEGISNRKGKRPSILSVTNITRNQSWSETRQRYYWNCFLEPMIFWETSPIVLFINYHFPKHWIFILTQQTCIEYPLHSRHCVGYIKKWTGFCESESVSCSVMSNFLWPYVLYVAHQASLSKGFSRQGYWSGLPFPSPGDLPIPGIEPGSLALQEDSLPLECTCPLKAVDVWDIHTHTHTHIYIHTYEYIFMHWRRKWQPTLVFLPWESQGRGSLVGCRLWGRTELDTTEVT